MRWLAVPSLCALGVLVLRWGWEPLRAELLSRALWAQVQRGDGSIVDFTRVAPFAWDRVYFFGPYIRPGRITETLGFPWAPAERIEVESGQGSCVVVFVRGQHVVLWFRHSLLRGNLSWLRDRKKGYAREEARFQVQQEENVGKPSFSLRGVEDSVAAP
jgi:hypothetical protein